MKGRDLAIKLSAYRTWVLSREWQREAPVLPLLLFIVPNPGQEGRVQRVAHAILQATTLQVYTTTATRLAEAGPLEAIWLPVGDFAQGAPSERCSWLDQAQRS
ncbi:MAG TPA: hypothetical protein VFB12_13765 [Ktedonobacteraceae bacterium]|nr:hypothetical protein [Ktedonobacteraceae bacterium]